MIDFNEIYKEYAEDTSIFNNESDRVKSVKHILWNKLDETDKRILLLYCEMGNLRDAAKLLNVSASTLCLKIKKIREIFLENMS